ncbi:DUF3322 domain-containing protein [Paenibacillus elgii]|uniref:Wadjet anti-phage system protein JetD domain-containing protein n=1 Tax=Paenibacillus elgii TaxID=189691 RepID=UPI002D7DF362|nr:DUF3322 domain-containing protein [Paenibacillus elgii]
MKRDYRHYVINRLLDNYEKSKHLTGNNMINRRVTLPFNPEKFPDYFIDSIHAEKEFINREMMELEQFNLIEIVWVKSQKNHLIDKIFLNVENVPQAYELVERIPLLDEITILTNMVSQYHGQIQTGWIRRFLEDSLDQLEKKKIPRWLSKDYVQTKLLLQALHGIELQVGESLPERLFSKKYLGNSKVFEKQIRNKMISIYKKYGMSEKLADIYVDQNNEGVLQEIGIVRSVEELCVYGSLVYEWNGTQLDFSSFPFGVTVHSQLMKASRVTDLRAERILIIENKTVFHEYIQSLSRIGNLLEKKIIVVYLGGFPGPDKRFFLRQIQDKFDKNGLQIEVQFWGDIDWGGFRIFLHLQKSVFPQLRPYRMDTATFHQHLEWAETFTSDYQAKLEQLLENTDNSEFHGLIREMLCTGKRLEQEAILL